METGNRSFYNLVAGNLAALLSGLYLLGSTIGMLDSWWFYC